VSRIFVFLIAAIAAQAVEPPRASDAREYELATQAAAAPDPEARLKSLAAWRSEYPETALEPQRRRLEMQARQLAGQPEESVSAAERVLELEPDDFAAQYLIASLAPAVAAKDPAAVDKGRRAARALLESGIDRQFQTRPADVRESRWTEMRQLVENRARLTLGWSALEQKRFVDAEQELTTLLATDPTSAQASYWLATALLAQKSPDKNDAAFFALARAAAQTGPGSLPEADRRSIRDYLEKLYRSYTGDAEGLAGLLAQAADQALPPEGMPRIQSKAERDAREEQRRRRESPKLYVFLDLRDALLGEGSASVWKDFQGKLSPQFELYVLRNEPEQRPLRLFLSSRPDGETEVVLNLQNRRRTPIRKGAPVVVEGVARTLKAAPFQLTLSDGRVLGP